MKALSKKRDDNVADSQRRMLLRTSIESAVALSVCSAVAAPATAADEPLPHVTLDDPQAKALQYTNDATQATRPDKAGVNGADQFCHDCQFLQGDRGEWRPCQIFAGKAVNENGWCITWMPKSG